MLENGLENDLSFGSSYFEGYNHNSYFLKLRRDFVFFSNLKNWA